MNYQKGQTFVEIIVGLAIVLVFIAIIGAVVFWPFIGANIHYSSGKRVGTLIKFSEKGFFVKNWCGEMAMGTFVQTDSGSSPYVFNFGIDRSKNDQNLINNINNDLGKKVELTYDQRGASNPWLGCSDYVITSVKEVK